MQQAMRSGQPTAPGGSPTSPSPAKFTPPSPTDLADAFPQLEIQELIGQGGMGVVYKARHIGLDRIVALKVLPPEAAADAAFAERFTREARTMASLSHPNIVTVFDTGQSEFTDSSGRTVPLYFFSMEYVDGVNLREAQQTAALSPQQALAIVPQVCDALQYAHDHGVVHRDIKPENVLLDKSGGVKVADFGLSKLLARTPVNVTLTGSQQVMGTLHYMAPEQMQTPLEVDHRADIYSLGVVFYELLTGEVPMGRFPLPSEKLKTDTRLDDVVLRAMEREPDKRYQQASHVKTDIESLSSIATAAHPPQREDHQAGEDPAWKPPLGVDDVDLEDARRQVNGPAIGLIAAGVVNLLPCVVLLFGFLLLIPPRAVMAGPGPVVAIAAPAVVAPGGMELVVIATIMGLNMPAGIVMLIGGIKMKKLESYGLAMTASILAMIPGMSCILALPFGIWSLVVLLRPEVKAAFDGTRVGRSNMWEAKPISDGEISLVRQQLRGPAIGLFCVAVLALLPFILAIVAVAIRFLFAPHQEPVLH